MLSVSVFHSRRSAASNVTLHCILGVQGSHINRFFIPIKIKSYDIYRKVTKFHSKHLATPRTLVFVCVCVTVIAVCKSLSKIMSQGQGNLVHVVKNRAEVVKKVADVIAEVSVKKISTSGVFNVGVSGKCSGLDTQGNVAIRLFQEDRWWVS